MPRLQWSHRLFRVLLIGAFQAASAQSTIAWNRPDFPPVTVSACKANHGQALVMHRDSALLIPASELGSGPMAPPTHPPTTSGGLPPAESLKLLSPLPAPLLVVVLPVMLVRTLIDQIADAKARNTNPAVAAGTERSFDSLRSCQARIAWQDSTTAWFLWPANEALGLDDIYTVMELRDHFESSDSLSITAPAPAPCPQTPQATIQSLQWLKSQLASSDHRSRRVSLPAAPLCASLLRLEIRATHTVNAAELPAHSDAAKDP